MRKKIFSALLAFIAIGLFASLHGQKVQAAQVSSTATYTVQAGDSLSSIAQNLLHDPNQWTTIYSLNQNQISNPNEIYAGEVLIVPSSNMTQSAQLAVGDDPQRIVTQQVTEKYVPIVATPVVVAHPTYAAGEAVYQGVINAAASQYGVSAAVMDAVIACESGFNPNSYNASSGASGIAQFLPSTWYEASNPFRGDSIWDPDAQIDRMAQTISQGGAHDWSCYTMIYH